MRRILWLLLFFAVINAGAYAQTVKYSIHTLEQGETLSMLATKFKTTVGDIMRLNGMHAQSQLVVGEKIKIPVAGKTVPPVAVEKAVPAPVAENSGALTHIVQQGETLYAISKKYGVTVDQLKQWNNLENVAIEIGQQLAVNSKGIAAAAAANKAATEKKAAEVKQPVTVTSADKTEEKIISIDSLAKADAEVKKPESKVVIVPANTKNASIQKPAVTGIVKDGSDSFFAMDFFAENSKKVKRAGGDAMTFKTASGWLDKKYYILMNGAPAGTIVKITAENGNSIYAKVLWKLDDMKLNQGLAFRVNEAAAAALNIAFNKFPLDIEYHE